MHTSRSRAQIESEVLRGNEGMPEERHRGPKLLRLLTDRHFALRAARYALGLPVPLDTEDRRVLEQEIFPFFQRQSGIRTVLFVGCDWYTRHYERAFFAGRNYWTLDVSPAARKHGGRQHVVAPLESLAGHFPPDFFDLIFCNGVYGYGLDTREQCELAFAACHSRLKKGGCFVLGWVDIPQRTPVPLDSLAALRHFEKMTFPPAGSWRYPTATPYRHTYDFYAK